MQLCTWLGVLFLIIVDPFHILWRQSNLIFFKFGKTLGSKLLKEVEILFLIQYCGIYFARSLGIFEVTKKDALLLFASLDRKKILC